MSGSVAIAATAADAGSGVASVEFRRDGVLLGTDTTAPYTSTWNATGASVGSHSLTARAVDVSGNAATSTVSVTIAAPADTTAPTVSITAPTAGSTVSGSVAIAATAADAGSGVASVEFRRDGVLLGTDTTAPYTSTWNATGASVGSHSLTARAVDVSGNAATSTVSVTIAAPADTTAPTVSITAPTAGSTVSGSVAIAATAADAGSGVASVEFRRDGVLIGTDTTAPYSAIWDASTASVGLHAVEAKAVDVAGNAATSTVSLSVLSPSDTTAPTVAITSPTEGATVWGDVVVAANASDAGGVARVEFRDNGTLIGTDVSPPYTATWDSLTASAIVHTIEARAIDTAGNAANTTVGLSVPQSPSLGLSSSRTWTEYLDSATLSGALRSASGDAVAGKVLKLQASSNGVTWSYTGDALMTSNTGAYSMKVRPYSKTWYRLVYAGDMTSLPAWSNAVSVNPKAYVSSISISRTSSYRNRSMKLYADLKPRHTEGSKPVRYVFWHSEHGKWVYKKTVWATAYDTSTYSRVKATTSLSLRGKWRIRAYHSDSGHYSSYSKYRDITVK